MPGRGDHSGGVTPTPPPVLTTREHGFAALRPAIRSGELTRLRRGAYVWRAAEREPWQERQDAILARCAAVAARFTTRYAFSHETAALLHGWPVTTLDDRIRVTQTVNPGGSSTPDVLRHVRADLPDGDLTTVAGLLVTTPDRTVLDCARYLPPDRGLVVVDGALRSLARMSPHRRAESEARQEATRSRLLGQLATIGPARGTARARAVLAVATGFAATPPESRLRWAALAAGLPEPVAQLPIEIGSRLFFADLAWVGDDGGWLLVVEFDGAVKYIGDETDPAQAARVVAAEKEREDLIRRHAAPLVRFERFTTADLSDPTAVARRLRAALPGPVRLSPRPALRPSPTRRARSW